ncbi:hypothetical protein B0H13DRAFT_1858533 [Mycena leptocephala]|nr:hypothetical protein B0H13DRAFT_1858533 [Mycena leptocephala]
MEALGTLDPVIAVEALCQRRNVSTLPLKQSREADRSKEPAHQRKAAALASGSNHPACKPDFDGEDVEVGNGWLHGGDGASGISRWLSERSIQPCNAITRSALNGRLAIGVLGDELEAENYMIL